MTRFVLMSLAWLVAASSPTTAAGRPNVVLIMADDMGYECVAANGGTSYKTPHLDKLAATGMRFEHCHVQPLCTPTRVQLMTGIYNVRNYIRFGLLDPKATTFAHLFRKAGYATCIAGKWQLEGGPQAPAHFGFDDHLLWQLTIRKSRYPNPVLERDGKILEHNKGEYGPDLVSDHLCAFIEKNRDRPFLAYYPMILPHDPFVPTPDSKDYDPKAPNVEKGGGGPKYYVDMVAYVDKMVGKVVAKLDSLGLRENTLIIFLCDNGTSPRVVSKVGDREVQGGKGKTLDVGTHVPLIANWTGRIPAGRVSKDLVDSTDFLPTILEAAGLELPKDLSIDGRSFYPQLEGKPGRPREWIYSWYARNGGPTGVELARDQRFKLYRDGKFFDVFADPLEKSPLSADKLDAEARRAREKLQAALDKFKGARRIE